MHDDEFDRGLQSDLNRLAAATQTRRDVLKWAFTASMVSLVGCGSSTASTTSTSASGSSSTTSSSSSTGGGSCTVIPEETGGPYPADGTNGPDVLNQSGIVRSDITSSFGAMTGVAHGVPLTITLTIVDAKNGCAPIPGAAVYLWHCDRDGNYSLYTAANENYLRGVQEADETGTVTFTSIFPGCYSGRWPHIHFEIYPSLAAATSAANRLATSQLAMPKDTCDAVYVAAGYEQSVVNLSKTSLASDMVFKDGAETETPVMSGAVASGLTATLTVGVNA